MTGPLGDRVGTTVRSLVVFATRPLTLSQVLSSASGALGVVLAASALDRTEFGSFALYNLVVNIAQGFGLAALFVPALIRQRVDPASFVRARALAAFAVPCCLGTAAVFLALGASVGETLALGAAIVAQPAYDWLRYRAIGVEQRWLVVAADALRLATVLVVPLVGGLYRSAAVLQTYLLVALLVPIAVMLVVGRRPRETAPYSAYAASAGWQVGDYVAGQFVLAVPLLVLGSTTSGTVAGIRLAQSLLGPLNLAFAASVGNLIADASTRPSLAGVEALIRAGSRISRNLALVAVAGVALAVGVIGITDLHLRGVANGDLVLGLVVVGAYSILSGWSGVHGTVIRLLDRQALVTVGRLVIAGAAVAGFVAGYTWAGAPTSVTLGFVTAGVASLVTFALMARGVYREERPVRDPERAA